MTQDDKTKATQFITYLFNSPQMKSENFITAESMIHTFISQNRKQLLHTFSSQQYFPHLSGEDAIRVVVTELFDIVHEQIFKPLSPFVNDSDFSFLNKISGQDLPPAFHRDKIREFTDILIKNKNVRANFSAAFNMFSSNAVKRYMGNIFKRRDFIYNELVRVQKTYLEIDEYVTFFKLLILLKHMVFIKIPLSKDNPDNKYTLADILKMPGKLDTYIKMLEEEVHRTVPSIPDRMIHLAVKANMPETMTAVDEGSSRLLYILTSRFNNYKAMDKVDRGAESPDKSWFAIARKNANMFGFEKNMLEELYRIAGDNNW